jgi:hypothetical protein
MSVAAPFTGRCFCGAITYHVTQDHPLRSYICHCIDCRQSSGSSFAHNALFNDEALAIADPDARLATFGNIQEGTKRFCSRCGTPLFLTTPATNTDMQGKVIVCVGTIDGSEKNKLLRPSAEGWCKRRETWMAKAEGSEEFDQW